MNELTSIIEDYLYQKNTDYAIFINGKWGTGKTYYAKNLTKVASYYVSFSVILCNSL